MANENNFISEGYSIYIDLEAKSSGGDIEAGDMVVLNCERAYAGNTATLTSLTGATSSQFMIGVAEHSLSGGKTGLTVLTKGVFQYQLNSGSAGTGFDGDPVIGVAAQEVAMLNLHANTTGMVSIGNLVNHYASPGAASVSTSEACWVKINPPLFRNICYGGRLTAAAPISGALTDTFPQVSTGVIFTAT